MADTNRLIINETDLSSTLVETTTPVTAFTVVKAPKGSITPVRIPAGGIAKVKDILGTSSKEYPELYEVERFVTGYDLYVSAPYSKASVPVAYITNDGVFPSESNIEYNKTVEDLINGMEDEDTDILGVTNFSQGVSILKDIRYPKSNGMGGQVDIIDTYPSYDGTEVELFIDTGFTKKEFAAFSKPLTLQIRNLPAINGETIIDLEIAENEGNVVVNQSATGYIPNQTVGPKVQIGFVGSANKTPFTGCLDTDEMYIYISGYDTSSSGLSLSTLDILTKDYIQSNLALEANRQGLTLAWKYTLDGETANKYIHGVIIPKYPSTRALHLSFQAFNSNRGYPNNTVASRNILKITVYEDGAFHNASQTVSITGSLNSGATDASGAAIGFTDSNASYTEQNLVFIYTTSPFTSMDGVNTNVTQYPPITLSGGTREFDGIDSVELHNLGWEEAKGEDYADVDVFFDSTRNTAETIWSEKSNTFYNLVEYHKQSRYIFNYSINPNNISTTPLLSFNFSKELLGARYWNLCNEGILNLSNGDKITTPITGVYSLMICDIISNRWGGLAPMWTNTRGMGGQLNINPLRLRYRYTKDQQDALNDLNFNPIIFDHTYGVMVVGQRTCKPGADTDWSYIGHVSSFLDFEKEAKINVMLPQIGKANNPYYRTLRKQQIDQLLSKRLSGDNRIWAQAYCDTSVADGINDSATRRARQFKIKVGVKVDTFSEYVILDFTTYDQDTNLMDISEYTIGDTE